MSGPARARPPKRSAWVGTALLLLGSACTGTGIQDALNPKGPQADRIATWFWFSFGLAIAVYLAFTVVFLYGLIRARRRERRGEENQLPTSHSRHLVIWGGLVGPLIVLFTLLVFSVYTDRHLARLGSPDGSDLTIEVIGHQFWWEVRYRDYENPYREFITANEIHIPVGRPVRLLLHSRDVIHSLWIPNLHGKRDLIPGRSATLLVQADEPGVYRGQCAEFCGAQHARMAFFTVAMAPAEFERWWDQQLQPHATPMDSVLMRGEHVFMSTGCAICHAIRGTDARGTVAPDLSYFGTRRSLGAGILPNTRGHLAGWIADPQGIKPGNRMPPIPLPGEDLQALISYLHSLR